MCRSTEGRKHRFATNAAQLGVPDRVVQRMPGHRDITSTRHYASLADDALVYAMRDREVTREGDGLFVRPIRERNVYENDRLMVEAAGIALGALSVLKS